MRSDDFPPTRLLSFLDVDLSEEGDGKHDLRGRKELHEAAVNGSVADDLLDVLGKNPNVLLVHSAIVGRLLALKPELARESNSDGSLPLHAAATKGYLGIAKDLLAACPKACLVWDHDGRAPLHLAAIKGRANVLPRWRESTRVLTEGGERALHLCVRYNKVEALKVLVERMGRDDGFLGWRDGDGSSALHCAVARKQLKIVRFLICQTGIDPNVRNARGFAPLKLLFRGPRDLRDTEIKRLLEGADAIRVHRADEITETVPWEEDMISLDL